MLVHTLNKIHYENSAEVSTHKAHEAPDVVTNKTVRAEH